VRNSRSSAPVLGLIMKINYDVSFDLGSPNIQSINVGEAEQASLTELDVGMSA